MIKCENVSIKYGGFTAITNVSFEVKKGDWLCITGENGCGKSSLVKAMLGLEKISGGKIIKNFSGGIGYVPQLPPVQNDFPASVFEIVLSGHIKKAGLFYSGEHKKNAEKKIEMLGIGDIKNACFRELSGGQRQRVLLARALCAGDKLLVLDEPMTGLDEAAEQDFYKTLEKLRENEMTIVMVSHDMKNVIKYADKVLCFEDSKAFFGDIKQFMERQGKS